MRTWNLVEQGDACKESGRAPQIPIAGASAAAAFIKKERVDLLFLGNLLAAHFMDFPPRCSLFFEARAKNPQEVFGLSVLRGLPFLADQRAFKWRWEGSGKTKMDGIFSERGVRLEFQGAGAPPWILVRRNGLARGVHNRLATDGRYCGKRVSSEAEWHLDASFSASGHSAYQVVFGSNLAHPYRWWDDDEQPVACPRHVVRWPVCGPAEIADAGSGGGREEKRMSI